MEGDDDGVFANLQRAPPRRRRGKANKDPFAKVPFWWIERAAREAVTASIRPCLAAAPCLAGEEHDFPYPEWRSRQTRLSRWVKYEVIDALEEAGLVTVTTRRQDADRDLSGAVT